MTKHILVSALVAALVAFGVSKIADNKTTVSSVETKQESALDRVLRTKTLRCGYNVWAPVVTVDPNTGKIGGFIPEMVETAAGYNGIKVQWVAQAGWGTFPQDLQNGKFDAMCAGAWATKELAPHVAFTRPMTTVSMPT
jgi:ABC-type amino acid transport substrate-binding protein